MRILSIFALSITLFILSTTFSFALIKLDEESVDLAIKYGIQSKDMPTKNILSSNWLNDGTGRILNIYSPFIQVALKTTDQNSTGKMEEDIKTIKKRLYSKIDRIKEKNEVRFLIALYGDTEDFANNYKAQIVDINEYEGQKKKIIKPKKTNAQKVAEKDNFFPAHPFSAVNCYIFKFDNLFDLKEYYFILTNETGEEVKYKINNNEIF
ncbi:MAG: hypothetical protein ACD_20C00172G0013 [uncultured bacterium]|nr:MAG: hypothetical protein ACD_20C00172G0013 [uncultured bacterium]HBH18747.1 hypothetical protein [Cyanobacteria bacterium UBA9579]